MIRLVTADLFKFLRRWMPYIILLLFCLYTANSIWNDYYSAKQKLESLSPLTYDDFAAAVEQIAPDEEYVTLVYSSDGVTHRRVLSSDIFDDAVLPEYIHWMFGNLNNYLYLCLPFVILAASFIGTEYKWGTLRQTLARGIGRNAYFGSKYVTLVILIWLFVCIVTLYFLIAGMATTRLITGEMTWDFISSDIAGYLLSSMGLITLILLAYAAFTALFSTIFKSTVAGMIAGVVYLQIENNVVWRAISDSGVEFGTVANPPEWLAYTITYNAQYLLGYITPDSTIYGEYLNYTITDTTQSILTLLAFCAVFILISYFIFRKQELAME
jgi:ABC-type transport system involved in multi-copper enzyme maturation permease subunit